MKPLPIDPLLPEVVAALRRQNRLVLRAAPGAGKTTRQLQCDAALTVIRELQDTVRPDLRLVVMSATLQTEQIAAYLGDCPVSTSDGREFPVAIEEPFSRCGRGARATCGRCTGWIHRPRPHSSARSASSTDWVRWMPPDEGLPPDSGPLLAEAVTALCIGRRGFDELRRADVLRGRYSKHAWPEGPLAA